MSAESFREVLRFTAVNGMALPKGISQITPRAFSYGFVGYKKAFLFGNSGYRLAFRFGVHVKQTRGGRREMGLPGRHFAFPRFL